MLIFKANLCVAIKLMLADLAKLNYCIVSLFGVLIYALMPCYFDYIFQDPKVILIA